MKQEIDWTEKAEQAILALEETDRQLAVLRYKYEKDKRSAKREWAKCFLRADGKNVEERKAQAETHENYQLAQQAELTSQGEHENLRQERETWVLIVEFWRSWQRNVNQGHV